MTTDSSLTRNYILMGVALGSGFAVGVAFDNFLVRPKQPPLAELLQTNPLHYLVFLSPLVLGALFFLLARAQARAAALSESKRASEKSFERLVNSVSDYAIYMLDIEGRIVSWNPGAARLKGYAAPEILGKNYELFYGADDRKLGLPAKNLAKALRDGKFEAEGWRYRKDGKKFWAQVLIEPVFDAAGKHIGFAKVTRERMEHKASADRVEYLAWHDWLTGLPNRGKFLRDLDAELQDAEISGRRVGVVNIDLDRFGEINDARGHAFGDQVLQAISSCMYEGIEAGESIARFGGDEFAAAKTYTKDCELANFVDRLSRCLKQKTLVDGIEVMLGASHGIARFPGDGHTAHQLIGNANMAMYRAKKSVGSDICFYESSMDEPARARRKMARELRSALDENQFHLLYQEQRSAKTEEVVGYEALIRWTHPTRGTVSPDQFLPVAEESGAILPIGAWALKAACLEAVKWKIKERICVNISPTQLSDADLANTVFETLIETGLSPARLEIEVTETAIIRDRHPALNTLRQLRSKGISIAIDDFGTGYSSLEMLRSFPFDRLKIDRGFVAGLEKDAQLRAILEAILDLGRCLNVKIVAEGVETREQARILAEAGCDELQGFLYGQPAPIASLRKANAAGQA